MSVLNFGCRLNAAEAEHIEGIAGSGVIVVNTCAVTAEAVRQARQAIRRAARAQPDARIVVTGCAAQIDPAGFAAMPEVARVLGNVEKLERGSYSFALPSPSGEGRETVPLHRPGGGAVPQRGVYGDTDDGRETHPGGALVATAPPPAPPPRGRGAVSEGRVRVADIMLATSISPRAPTSFAHHTRAFVEIQTGCDHRCTFCIIPFGRGNSRSLPAAAIVEHIARLVDGGVNEVVLTGVDITSFGPEPLGILVQRILREVPALPRLRLSSIDSIEVDDALVEAAADPRLMPQFHLSLQAGDDLILKRMKRRHSRDQAIAICDRLRAVRPGIAFGADFITGFPTETEAMFDQTLTLVDECGLSQLHVFPFSPRPGTPAARMPQVAPAIARERAARLRALGDLRRSAAMATEIGRPQRILVERDGVGGHSETFLPVRLATPAARGSIVRVTALSVTGGKLDCG
ncbi:tRNA (N(6)-L-threonylcarbamoyladenosine(37)-C(2))-methylthiotransferase MtaB [Polymorphobacter sp. PAMC 29334]|uniref:tRNA (N(6)-L-threonylcarbamoyladenosine(37)-C(2))- methylthiotransferase MtaB n=1 Tax=Polymorphobacter sp. PAMC 29334 TaxID=2862331 RepID=UPI001C7628D0|nr:tRNA (N(6)-L-threonylcarbamoyladenosine(37)-C(2))-methylthiotransferase MtaB [Polymorphobacter sp. PAMC 29334]QYE36282.1 tRNA (N(6)-L-threonylcarbamoyladenosine(37)-C(2))-methylthiotransferase MtaB [Polymorphobacter sp. PAMC 29334]